MFWLAMAEFIYSCAESLKVDDGLRQVGAEAEQRLRGGWERKQVQVRADGRGRSQRRPGSRVLLLLLLLVQEKRHVL